MYMYTQNGRLYLGLVQPSSPPNNANFRGKDWMTLCMEFVHWFNSACFLEVRHQQENARS